MSQGTASSEVNSALDQQEIEASEAQKQPKKSFWNQVSKYIISWYMSSPINGSFLTGYVWPHITKYSGYNPLGRCIAITSKDGWGFEVEIKAASKIALKDTRGICYFWVTPVAPALLITRESEIRQVLEYNNANHERGTILQTLERIYPHNIFGSLRDEKWKKRRVDLLNRLSTEAALKNMVDTMQEVMDEKLSDLEKEKQVNLQHLFTQVAMTTLERTQFGTKSNPEATEKLSDNYEDAFKQVLNYKNVPKMWLYEFANKLGIIKILSFFMDTTLAIDKAKNNLYQSLKKHLFTPENEKVLRSDANGLLMKIAQSAQPDVQEQDLKLDVERVILEAAFLFLAGHETTSRLLQFTAMLLAEHPWVTEKIRSEINAGPSRHYLKAVIDETLRLYPAVPYFGRAVTKPFIIGNIPVAKDKKEYEVFMAKRDVRDDIKLKPGDMILMSPDTSHRDEYNYEDAMKFIPERFITGSTSKKPEFYFPFGVGDRRCPGQRFSLQETMIALEKLVMNYDIELLDKNVKHPYSTNILGTLHATEQVYVRFKKVTSRDSC